MMVVKIAWIVLLSTTLAYSVEDKVDFQREVRPILSDKCFFCHGTDPKTRESDLRLDLPEEAYQDLGGYAAVVPGKVKESELYLKIISKKKKEMMRLNFVIMHIEPKFIIPFGNCWSKLRPIL